VGHRVGRRGDDPHLQLPEVVGNRGILFAGTQTTQRFDLQRETAAGSVSTEYEEDRSLGQDGQLGPDRQEPLGTAQ
jgi:hypothetical protein